MPEMRATASPSAMPTSTCCGPASALLLILDGRGEAFSFERVDVDDNGMVDVLDLLESLDELIDIVSLLEIEVIVAHGLEEIEFGGAFGLPEEREIAIKTAVVLGDGHLIVVDHDDDVRASLRRNIQPLESLATA